MKARMEPRDFYEAAPATVKALRSIGEAVKASGLDPLLIELVKTRASQINGCAYCVEMHTREAREAGESEARLHLVAVWRESPFFTTRERAALAWTEALTLLADDRAPDAVYDEARREFSAAELAQLTSLIATINAWNRIGVGLRFLHPTTAAKRG
jgi:AhpD family alkylhydroperoxidase